MDERPYIDTQLIETARALAPAITAAGDEIEARRRLPEHLLAKLRDAGLFKMIVPRSVGGLEVTLATYIRVIEQIAAADGSTAWCMGQASGVSLVSGFLPHESSLAIFGRPETIPAWGNGPNTAVEVPGGYRLTGQWNFASGIHGATWLGSNHCRIVHEDGTAVIEPNGRPRERVLIFPKSEAEITDVWQVSGLRGTGSDSYRVTDLFVPDAQVCRREPQEPGILYQMTTTQIFAPGFASVALGIARGMLDAVLELASGKTPRGMTGKLRDQPAVQGRYAEAEAAWRSARALLHTTADEMWAEVSANGKLSMEQRVNLRLACTHAAQTSARVVQTMHSLAGASAIFTSGPFERRFRDMHAVTQQVQARYDHFETAGRYFFGLEPGTEFL